MDQDDSPVTILMDGALTAGQLALVLSTEYADREPPCQRHQGEDKVLYLLEGELMVWCDGQWHPLSTEQAFHIPRGTEHTFTVFTSSVRLLTIFTPAGFEGFYRDLGPHARWEPGNAHAIEQWVVTAARYGCEVTGPHPGRAPRKAGTP